MIGVLGGMGPAATVDFLAKLVALTPANCDQQHLPVLVANLPHVPDRSRAILGVGEDPLVHMLRGISLLNQAGTGLNLVPCNTSHHWYAQMARHSQAPMLHIAQASVAALPVGGPGPVAVFATRGTLQSGFYQQALARLGIGHQAPDVDLAQPAIDACIQAVKAGDLARGSQQLALALGLAQRQGVQTVIMACTEIPLAAQALPPQPLQLIDSTLELARQAVRYGLFRRWNQMPAAPHTLAPDGHPSHPSHPAGDTLVQPLPTPHHPGVPQ